MCEAAHAAQLQEKRQLGGRVRSPAARRIPRQQSLDLMTILDAVFQFRSPPIVLMNLFSYRRSAFHVEDYSTLIGARYELSRTCVNATTGKD